MSRKQMLLRLMLKAAWVRKDRAFTALLSIAVVATMATVALTVYSDLQGKFSREFRSFGANAIVTANSGSLTADELQRIRNTVGEKSEVVPVGYAVVAGDSGQRLVAAGTDVPAFRKLNSSWSFTRSQSEQSDPLVGFRAAEALSLQTEQLHLHYDGKMFLSRTQVIFHSGSEDDSRIFLSLEDFQQLTGLQPNTAQLRIDGPPDEIERRIAILSASLPETDVKPVRQVVTAETAVLGKTRSIVLAASAVVVVLIVVCMVVTLTGAVLERRKDFAVMKALGASNNAVNLLFAGEAALTSIAGAILGFLIGTAIAFWIGYSNFGTAIPPRPDLLAPVIVGSVLLALLASTAPLRVLRRIQPARILRGE